MSSFLLRWWKAIFLCQPHDSLALPLHSKAWQYSSFSSQITQSTDAKKKKYTHTKKYKLSLYHLKESSRDIWHQFKGLKRPC